LYVADYFNGGIYSISAWHTPDADRLGGTALASLRTNSKSGFKWGDVRPHYSNSFNQAKPKLSSR
jgi:hypothetical protein